MTTFEPCQQTLFDETECGPSMSLPAGSPAKIYHMLASELALKVSDLVCGRSSLDLLARFDPGLRSWKTCQASLVLGMDEFSETWPRSGMMQRGTAYPLPPSAPLTGGTASGLLPTPEASNTKAVAWPTARSSDHKGAVTATETTRRRVESGQANLPEAVVESQRMWPTPTTRDWKDGSAEACQSVPANGLPGRVVHQFPTPRAQSAHGSGPSRVGNKADLQTIVGGSLNPDWVEWLMGFPIGRTKLDGWKSRKASPALPQASKTAPRG